MTESTSSTRANSAASKVAAVCSAMALAAVAGVAGVTWARPSLPLWSIAALAVALAVAMSWACWRYLVGPLLRMRDALRAMAAGEDRSADLHVVEGRGIAGDMAKSLQRVLERDRAAEADRNRLVSQMRSMLEHATVGLVITIDRRMVIVSRAFWTMFGYEEHEMLGQPGRLIYPSDEAYADIGPRVGKAFAERGQFDTEIQMIRKDGSLFWCQLMGRPVDPKNMSAGTMWVLYDISDMRAQREQLEWASSHDPLTRLANRTAFERALDQVLEAGRQGSSQGLGAAVLMLDLDRFKQVNDTGGHAAGDQLLRDIAAVMTGRLRQSDVVARLGGDEFAVLLHHCDEAHAADVAESLRGLIHDYRLEWEGRTHSVGVSIGVFHVPPAIVMSREAILAAADAACYEAKHGGRDRVCVAGAGEHAPGVSL